LEQTRAAWKHEGVVAWLLLLGGLLAFVDPIGYWPSWVLMNLVMIAALFFMWRWSTWRRRFKWTWTVVIILLWLVAFFRERDVDTNEASAFQAESTIETALTIDSPPFPLHIPS
jgi:hypothetical protein